jgi:hypothetical protein
MNRIVLGAAVLMFASTSAAHHGWSGYDSSQEVTLTGKIVESGYEHPHGHLRLATSGKTWLVVLAPPSRMENRGLSKEALKAGTTATVVGYPSRGKPQDMRAARITVQAKTVELR